jgi:hypothetical protein
MPKQERRKHRRTRLRLRISRIDGLPIQDSEVVLWTCDVSPGGMYLQVPVVEPATVGSPIAFELSIPPGEGYSISAGRVRGSGKVVRIEPSAVPMAGIAVGFTAPLALEF